MLGWPGMCDGLAFLFALGQLLAFVIALMAIVSMVALYIYEHPHHHCPFCILKSGHNFLGYFLYLPLFASAAFAVGVGSMAPFGRIPSLHAVIEKESRRLILWSVSLMMLFYLVSTWSILRSSLSMRGVWW